MMMKRKKSMLMAALMMAVASMMSCTPQTTYVIEGELKGLEEGTEIQLFQNDEVVLTSIASTRLENGKFRFEMEMAPDTTIFVQLVVGWNYGSLPRLWVKQSTRTTIKGEYHNFPVATETNKLGKERNERNKEGATKDDIMAIVKK